MISYLDAISIIKKNAYTLPSEKITVTDSLNRILSNDIYSPIDLPSFDNSAMDGFAIKYIDSNLASVDNPLSLLVKATIAAEVKEKSVANDEPNTCCEIMTGAAIPVGYDAVVPIEMVEHYTENNKSYIRINTPIAKFANIRFSGEDVKQGTLIKSSTQQIKPSDIMLFHALGITNIDVFKKLEISIASTGNEVSDNYSEPLRYGEIYNSNSPLLLNMATETCFKANYYGILPDENQALSEFITNTSEQILVTTGAVSKGKWDFIPETLRSLGAEILFHSVAIRPGKPILFAKLKDGRFFFGLPGNPVSSMVGWRFFLIPLFYAMIKKSEEQPIRLKLKNSFNKPHKLRQFLKADMSIEDGIAYATIDNGQESFKISPLTYCNIWAVANEDDNNMSAESYINAYTLYPNL